MTMVTPAARAAMPGRMLHLPPLDHAGRPIPVPRPALFGWRIQGVQALTTYAGMLAIGVVSAILNGLFEGESAGAIVAAIPEALSVMLFVATLLVVVFVGGSILAWPWLRRGRGRTIETRIEQLADADLDGEIALTTDAVAAARTERERAMFQAWLDWLGAKRAARSPRVAVERLGGADRIILRPSRRKLIVSTLAMAIFVGAGAWLLALAVIGGDGGTGIKGFVGPNAMWTKLFIGAALVLTGIVPLVEAWTVRVEADDLDLRKRLVGRIWWTIPHAHVRLVEDDSEDLVWQVRDARSDKIIGRLNRHHFDDAQFLSLVQRIRASGDSILQDAFRP